MMELDKNPIFISLIALLLLLAIQTQTFSQKTICLEKEEIHPGLLNYNIVEVVDARDVRAIGAVQKGINNKWRWADFDHSVEEEIMDLIVRSGATSSTPPDMVMRITKLNVSETTSVWSESGVTELSVDFFFLLDDQLYYITTVHSNQRTKAADVTRHHRSNIALAVDEVLRRFNTYDLEQHIIDEAPIYWDQLADYVPVVPLYPIMEVDEFENAIYRTVEEFRANSPSVWDGYEIREGQSLEIRWLDEEGKRTREFVTVCAIAHNGRLYFYFENEFYAVEKHGDSLIFFGATTSSPGQMSRAWFWGGMAGAAMSKSGENVRMVYEIDLNTGGVKELGFSR